jgi:hypothetical protein
MRRGGLLLMNAESNDWEMGGSHGLSPEEMKKAGERIYNLEKVYNVREGWVKKR